MLYFFWQKVAAVFYNPSAYNEIAGAQDWDHFTPEQLQSTEMQVYVDSYFAETGHLPVQLVAQINHTMEGQSYGFV